MCNQIYAARTFGFLEDVFHRCARNSLTTIRRVNRNTADIDALIRSYAVRCGAYDNFAVPYEVERIFADLPQRILDRTYWNVDPICGFPFKGGNIIRLRCRRLSNYELPN